MEEQNKPEREEQENPLSFVDRLKLQDLVHSPARAWFAWFGIILFIGLVIVYYLTIGGTS